MGMKKTLILSIFLHAGFFSAAFLLSAGMIKGSRSIPADSIFFVRLAEDKGAAGSEGILHEKDSIKSKEITGAKQKKKPVVIVREEAEAIKAVTRVEKINNPGSEPEAPENVSPSASETVSEHLVVSAISVAESAGMDESIPEDDGFTKGETKGALPPGITEIIGSAIERAKTYPLIARKRGIEGTVYVSFLISSNGKPREIEILKSSGFRILDRATVKVVEKAGPYPHIENRIEVPVAYKLRD